MEFAAVNLRNNLLAGYMFELAFKRVIVIGFYQNLEQRFAVFKDTIRIWSSI